MITHTAAALLETHRLGLRAEALAKGSSGERKQADAILAQIASINKYGMSPDEARRLILNASLEELGLDPVDYSKKAAEQRHCEKVFRRFIAGVGESELRELDAAAGQQMIDWSAGPAAGFLVPQTFNDSVVLGLKAITPLLDESVVTMKGPTTGSPFTIPGWDLSEISSTIIGENTQRLNGTMPTAIANLLNFATFRTDPIAVSYEFEQDSFEDVLSLMTKAFTIGLARGIGPYLQTGQGVTASPPQPSGIVTGATDTGFRTIDSQTVDVGTLLDTFSAVDVIHRSSPKCAWVMSDDVWLAIKKTAAYATNGYVLSLNKASDNELLGKPVHIDNSIPAGLPSSPIIFGDLGYFFVAKTGLRIRRNIETQIESGKFLYTAQLRVASVLMVAGSDVPVVVSNVSS